MTIEERAKEYAQAYDPKESAVQYAVERAYGVGASEQKEIDNKEFYKVYCLLCPCYMDGCAGDCNKLQYIKHILEK